MTLALYLTAASVLGVCLVVIGLVAGVDWLLGDDPFLAGDDDERWGGLD